ncbi:transcriptional regulator, PadR family [Georgenia satyanarayanai]|uniref:Transcriptional regulator, PadR family n=1 Tax=Georgenia satyanarayanai TaxID=860221 RepID=A0A2Y9AT72_9MICO|nr:PadR family transcriptional regulator [Georgenia satyanarayanai]PYF97895.1 PadR family transcriptional regulator [Georgenia satyanarayanai]SSA45469.1 transcriptional regulator, PadR family [Georgenia satyanarayanai]
MSVRHGLLALLVDGPMHTYQLKQQFEERTGGTWPLNIGQVYTTVQRLVRDGLVETCADDGGEVERFRLTATGADAAAAWWTTPVSRGTPARDELVIKLALAATAEGVDVLDLVQRQRRESMRSLHEYTRLHRTTGDDLAWSLVLDHLIFTLEAELRWLDHVEAKVVRAARTRTERRPADRAATEETQEARS